MWPLALMIEPEPRLAEVAPVGTMMRTAALSARTKAGSRPLLGFGCSTTGAVVGLAAAAGAAVGAAGFAGASVGFGTAVGFDTWAIGFETAVGAGVEVATGRTV